MTRGTANATSNHGRTNSTVTAQPYSPAQIRAIVDEVIRRIRDEDAEDRVPQHAVLDRIVTVQSIESIESGAEVVIPTNAIVTAAAQDFARDRGIRLHRDSIRIPSGNPESMSDEIESRVTDTDDPNRAALVVSQLRRRDVTRLIGRIVLSEMPASAVIQEIKQGESAVMINRLDQIERFKRECDPSTWVLDLKQLNLSAAINVIARISKLETVTA